MYRHPPDTNRFSPAGQFVLINRHLTQVPHPLDVEINQMTQRFRMLFQLFKLIST